MRNSALVENINETSIRNGRVVVYHETNVHPREFIDGFKNPLIHNTTANGQFYGNGVYCFGDSGLCQGKYGKYTLKLSVRLGDVIIYDKSLAIARFGEHGSSLVAQFSRIGVSDVDILNELRELDYSDYNGMENRIAHKYKKITERYADTIIFNSENGDFTLVSYNFDNITLLNGRGRFITDTVNGPIKTRTINTVDRSRTKSMHRDEIINSIDEFSKLPSERQINLINQFTNHFTKMFTLHPELLEKFDSDVRGVIFNKYSDIFIDAISHGNDDILKALPDRLQIFNQTPDAMLSISDRNSGIWYVFNADQLHYMLTQNHDVGSRICRDIHSLNRLKPDGMIYALTNYSDECHDTLADNINVLEDIFNTLKSSGPLNNIWASARYIDLVIKMLELNDYTYTNLSMHIVRSIYLHARSVFIKMAEKYPEVVFCLYKVRDSDGNVVDARLDILDTNPEIFMRYIKIDGLDGFSGDSINYIYNKLGVLDYANR